MKTIHNIQFLRGVAAILVVGVHLSPALDFTVPRGGVDLFFVISGFIMAHTASESPPTDFAWRRIARVAPLYWLLTLFTFGCAIVAPALFKSTSADPIALAKSLFFVPFTKPGASVAQPLLFVGWTLNYEMMFYALFAVGLALRRAVVFTSAAILLLIIIGLAARPTNATLVFYTDPIMLEFVLGMGVAALYKRGILPAAAITGAPALLIADYVFPESARAISLGIPAALTLIAALKWERLKLGGKAGLQMGAASYSLYLTHPFIAAAAVAIAPHQYRPLVAAIGFGTCVATALAVFRYIERPITHRLHSLVNAGDKIATAGGHDGPAVIPLRDVHFRQVGRANAGGHYGAG